MINITEKIL